MNKQYLQQLQKFLTENLKNSIQFKDKNQKIALGFSGGLDSCIIAKLLKDLKIKYTAYVVGVKDCKDLDTAETASKELNIPLKKIILTEKIIKKYLPVQIEILKQLYEKNKQQIKPETPEKKLNPVSVTSNFPLFFVEKYSKEKIIVSGLGADTIFGGFYKYLNLARQESINQIKKETDILEKFDYKEDITTAAYFNKQIIMPFLDKKVINLSRKIPYELKIKNKQRKYILRKLAREIKLSKSISEREKKSAQYGSGIMKIILRLAKEQGLSLTQQIKQIAEY